MSELIYIALAGILITASCSSNNHCIDMQGVTPGMKRAEVISVMKGQPDSVLFDFFGPQQFSYMYTAPFGASDNVYINFSTRDSLITTVTGCR